MKRQLLIVVCVATSAAFALPPVRPVLPSVVQILPDSLAILMR